MTSAEKFSRENYLEGYGIRVKLRSTRVWKGNVGKEATVLTGRGGGDCGYLFTPGKSYLVFARSVSGTRLETDICTRTKEFSAAKSDVALLESAARGR